MMPSTTKKMSSRLHGNQGAACSAILALSLVAGRSYAQTANSSTPSMPAPSEVQPGTSLEGATTGTTFATTPAAPAAAPTGVATARAIDSSSATGTADTAAAEAAAFESALAARTAAAEIESDSPKLTAYGFADFSYARRFNNADNNIVGNRLPSFYVGNANLYLGGELGSHWRALSEFRVTYLPDGVTDYNSGSTTIPRTSTAYPDYADYYRNRKVGGVIIERVQVEYAAHPLLNVRMGQWLTPYGIWNVDHGSPVVIGVTRPYIVGNEWLPSRQTGIEIYGSHGIDATSFGYHLTISNGRGPVDYEDLDTNKALGWRLWARHDSKIGSFTLGTSGYRGQYTETVTQLDPVAVSFKFPVKTQYMELGLAADFKWTWGGYLLQAELISHDVAYDHRARPNSFMSNQSWTPDSRQWGFYTITGYRFPWLGVMPFVGNQYQNMGKGNALTCWELNGGFNVRPTERIVLKAVALWVWRPENGTFSKSEGQFLSQIAWSF